MCPCSTITLGEGSKSIPFVSFSLFYYLRYLVHSQRIDLPRSYQSNAFGGQEMMFQQIPLCTERALVHLIQHVCKGTGENTHLLFMGKYRWSDDLLIICMDSTIKVNLLLDLNKQNYLPNPSRKSGERRCSPLQCTDIKMEPLFCLIFFYDCILQVM